LREFQALSGQKAAAGGPARPRPPGASDRGSLARARLAYSVGNEHNPGNPFGRSELTIEPDGAARLDHFQLGQQQAWIGRVTPAALDRLRSALERAGFPNVPDHPLPAGSSVRALRAESEGASRAASLEWHAARKLPGYDEAFPIIDAIVHQMSAGAAESAPDGQPPVVTDIQRLS
jgi:hypothetical protein